MAKSFEQDMNELRDITEKLGSGEVSLDEALALYERGAKLADACQKRLADAETRVGVIERSADE